MLARWVAAVAASIVMGFLGTGVCAGEDNDPHATGCRRPTADEKAQAQATSMRIKRIHLNALGLERINAARKAKGAQPAAQQPVQFGDEIDGTPASQPATSDVVAAAEEPIVGLPVDVNNTQLACFPPISSQGSLGSCASFSTTYYQMTHMVGLARGYNNKTDNSHRFSPKWVYNMINGGSDSGSWNETAHQVQLDTGCATWPEFPYDSNYRAWCRDAAIWRNAIGVRMNQKGYISGVDAAAGLDQLKQLLNNGYVVTFATNVYGWKFTTIKDDTSTTDDSAYVGWPVCHYVLSGQGGGHAMTIAGYNDALWCDVNGNGIIDNGEKGALLIVNSWGTGWQRGGMAWLAYDALKATSAVTGAPTPREGAFWYNEIYWITARASYTPSLIGEFTVNHAKRNQMAMSVGKSATSATKPSTSWNPSTSLRYAGGAYAFDGSTTACDGSFCLDMTGLAPDQGTLRRYYLGMTDSSSGTETGLIASFKLIDVTAGNVVKYATNVPQTANANTVYAYIDYAYNNAALPAVTITASTPNASETGPTTGKFTLTRTGAASSSLNVTVSIAGTAANGTDYQSLSTTVTIPANAASADVIVTPIDDSAVEPSETVVMTIVPAASYNAAIPDSATVTIANNDVYGNGPGTGITREWWDGISGTAVANLTSDANYPNNPTGTALVTAAFEAPTNRADNYGTRMHGYFIAPATGAYTFYIASDDGSELWLSTSSDPAGAVKIAYVSSYTGSREWTKEANQKSAAVNLVAGGRYYIRALQKEGGGGDNLAVGVDLPPGIAERPIPGHRLDPWVSQSAPVAPANLTASAASSSQINLAWTDNATNETGFKLERKTGATGTWAQIATPAVNATSYSDTGLAVATTYYYRLRASNAAGDSAYSNEASAITSDVAPAVPTNLAASAASSSQINLTWVDNASNETGFKLERKTGSTGTWAQIATPAANATSFSNTGLTPATTYFYRIRATNAVGDSAYSNEASATTQDVAPVAPTTLAASAASSSQINLTWVDNASNETGFKLERKTGATGTWAQVATPAANATSYSNTGLSPVTTYYYRLRATNAVGDSVYSNEASATTLDTVPAAPANLAATIPGPTQVNMSWTDNASNETGFKVQRKTGSAGTWGQIGTTGANVTTYSDTTATAGTAYWYRVCASNAVGDSGYSNELAVTTPAAGTGSGLTAYYYDNSDLTAIKLIRVDATVNFDFGNGSPDSIIGAETFSARWLGQVQPFYSETYTFYTSSDDGVRLWVNGQPVVDNWTDHGPTENSGTVALVAGQKYDIRMEYYENGGGAVAKLLWSSATQAKTVIPATQLYTVNRAPEIVNAAAAASNPVTGTTTALSVLGADDGGEASLAYTWTATTAPSGATPIFSANGTNAAKNVNVTCNRAGAYTFQATIRDAGNLTATSSVTVTVNQTLTSVAVAPASVTLPLNGTQPLSATARDQFGVAMAAAFTWSSSGVGSVNTTGLYAAGAAPGSSTVMASTGGKSATASVNVVNTAPVVQTAASATPSTVTGTTTALAVLGADDGGEANLTYTWAATATPAGATPSFSANGTNAAKTTTVTFTKAGTYAFQATIRDQAGLSVTSSINVTVNQTLTSVAVAPTSATLPLNGTRQFTASATDQFGAPMTVPFAWSLSGVGSVSSSGLYAAGGVAGSATVTASAGGKSASASMTVVNTVPVVQTAASASPNPVNGTTTVLSVLGADDGGEANLTYTWSATAAPAGAAPSFSANGTNTAKSATVTFGQAGVYAFAVTIADQGGLTVASSVSVTVQQTLSALTIAPTSVSLPRDSSQQFIAAAADQFSIPMAVPLTWTCSGVGSVNDTGMYLSGRARGTATVTVSSGALSASASVTVRKSIAPVLASPAAATTDQAVVGQTLQFSAAPSAPDGNPLACAWDFGDGSPAVIGTVANHLYVTGGIYTVTFTAYDSSDPEAEVSASTLTIVVAEPSAGPDGASPPAPDSDGDGVSDLNETLDGTDPLDPDSFVAVPFEVTKLAGAFRVGEGGRDTCAISGRLPDIPAGFTPNGQVMVVDIAGAQATFTFTSKGRAKAVGGAAALKLTPAKRDPVTRKATFGGGALAFSAKLGKGSWAGVWALAGLDAAENRKNVPVTLPVLIRFAGKAYAATATVTFSASADKMGKFKSGFSGGRMGF